MAFSNDINEKIFEYLDCEDMIKRNEIFNNYIYTHIHSLSKQDEDIEGYLCLCINNLNPTLDPETQLIEYVKEYKKTNNKKTYVENKLTISFQSPIFGQCEDNWEDCRLTWENLLSDKLFIEDNIFIDNESAVKKVCEYFNDEIITNVVMNSSSSIEKKNVDLAILLQLFHKFKQEEPLNIEDIDKVREYDLRITM